MLTHQSLLRAVLVALYTSFTAATGEAPVCDQQDVQCQRATSEPSQCGLYWAKSTQMDDDGSPLMGLFAGVARRKGEPVAGDEIMLSLMDANKNEWSPWHDFFWLSSVIEGSSLENDFYHDIFLPGVASMASCSPEDLVNTVPNLTKGHVDTTGVHRSKDPTAGAFAYNYGYRYDALEDIDAGEEIFVSCDLIPPSNSSPSRPAIRPTRTLSWLRQNGHCLDNLFVAKSKIDGAGRGAFSKRHVPIGERITLSPVLHFDRSQVELVEQRYNDQQPVPLIRSHGIEYDNTKVLGYSLLLNYVYGSKDSNVFLLPFGPDVNMINHSKRPNAYLRWAKMGAFSPDYFHLLNPYELFDEAAGGFDTSLVIEIVALKDIAAGEEVTLDYGEDWQAAWDEHVRNWQPKASDYQSATDYNASHFKDPIRTAEEQVTQPYPDNLQTACHFDMAISQAALENDGKAEWKTSNKQHCLRHCTVEARRGDRYTARVFSRPGVAESELCGRLPADGILISNMPRSAITLVDKPYTSDQHMRDAFRHEIGVPEAFFPAKWSKKDPRSKGDFMPTPLEPGEVAKIRWADTGKVVTDNAYRLGLSERVRQGLLDYCNKMGITDIFRHITSKGNALESGTDSFLVLDGEQWYLQRPEKKWMSNLQWLSPGDNPAHEHYLQALSASGFDEMLDMIGRQMNMEALVAFHVTFIAVSHSITGFVHYDGESLHGRKRCLSSLVSHGNLYSPQSRKRVPRRTMSSSL